MKHVYSLVGCFPKAPTKFEDCTIQKSLEFKKYVPGRHNTEPKTNKGYYLIITNVFKKFEV